MSTISSTANENFQLKDGVLAWIESSRTAKALKALYNGITTIVSNQTTSTFYGTSGGYVIYGEGGKVYARNAATKTSTVLIDAAPAQVKLNGSTMYFVMGSGKAVYRLNLIQSVASGAMGLGTGVSGLISSYGDAILLQS